MLSGIPCCHAISSMKFNNQEPRDCILTCFRKEAYESVYAPIIHAVNGTKLWKRTWCNDVLPPKKKMLDQP